MSKANAFAYERFLDYIELRRAEMHENSDIRQTVLSYAQKPIGLGYVGKAVNGGYGNNLKNVFKKSYPLEAKEWAGAEAYFALGALYEDASKSHGGASRLFQNADPSKEVFLFEQGFLASSHSWVHAFEQHDPIYSCLGYVFDDLAHYYMADYPNRLIERLNSGFEVGPEELARARALIDRIVAQRISKYNAQPMRAPTMTEGYTRRVMVCDQAFADASTVYGKIDQEGFEQMLLAAIQENPDAEVLVKSHPDTFWKTGQRSGYYSHLEDHGRVRILRSPVNPFSLFEHVDTVYVGTSQLGLEALFAGKKVVCFGAPFYGGWGLTDDRQPMPHRHRTRTLEELFHIFYDWYTIYNVPGVDGPATIEQALDHIVAHRPVLLPPAEEEISAPPVVSVVLPVHSVQDYIEECIRSIQMQTLREIEIIPINDCSPDGSQDIIDRLAAEDPRIRPIVLKDNVGQGFARNIGLDAARGEYVFLLDSDDVLSSGEVLEKAVEEARATGSDMVRVQKWMFEDGKGPKSASIDLNELTFAEEKILASPMEETKILKSWHCWQFLYARKLLNDHDVRFVSRQWEERYFVTKALKHTNQVAVLNIPGVSYRVRVGSTTKRARTDADFDLMMTNVRKTGEEFSGTTAGAFLGAQFASFFVRGSWLPFLVGKLRSGHADEYVAKLREGFEAFALDWQEIVPVAHESTNTHRYDAQIGLLWAAARAGNTELVRLAVNNEPIEQARLYEYFAKAPETKAESQLVSALNVYARNECVKPTPQSAKGTDLPRIIFHIGASKTGSTYLQHLLEANRPELLRQGIWYPETAVFWQANRPHKQAGHARATRAVFTNDPSLRDYINAGIALHEGRIHTIIFSSEAFFLNERAQELAQYFSGFDMSVVLYVRRQDEWANSQYAEFVGGGAVGRVDVPIGEWLERENVGRLMDYNTTLERWSAVLGKEAMKVRIYDRDEFPDRDMVADFAEATGLSQLTELERPGDKLANDVQLSTPHVLALRLFNTMVYPDREGYFSFIQGVTESISAWRKANGKDMPKPDLLSADERRKLLERLSAANEALKATYFPDRRKALFSSKMPAKRKPESEALAVEELEIIWSQYNTFGGLPPKPAPKPAPAKPAVKAAPAKAPAKPPAKVPAKAPAKAVNGVALDLSTTAYPVRSLQFVMGAALLQFSDLFDGKWYKQTYPDVGQAKVPPVVHFLTTGCAEGRNPGPSFNTKRYYQNNPDVLAAGENALVHYLRHGRREGRT